MAQAAYERRSNESEPAFAAFVVYRDLRDERSHVKVADMVGKNSHLISRWSKRHSWRTRVHEFDLENDRRKRLSDRREIDLMRRRQTKIAVDLQDLGSSELKRLKGRAERAKKANIVDPGLILKLIDLGTRLERLNRGEPGEIIEQHIDSGVDLSGLSVDELKALREIRTKLRAQQAETDEAESRATMETGKGTPHNDDD